MSVLLRGYCYLLQLKKRQWCLECILKFEGFAKTKGFLLCSDLLSKTLSTHQTGPDADG